MNNTFKAIQPSPLLAPYIRQYWFLSLENIGKTSQRMIPSGCMGMYFLLNGTQICSQADTCAKPASYLYGQTTTYDTLTFSGTIKFLAVIFRSAAAKAFFRIPLNEIINRRISLDELGDTQLIELDKKLPDTDMPTAIGLIEKYLLQCLQNNLPSDNSRLNTVVQSIKNGICDVSTLADISCFSYKQFQRLFTRYIGLNPKEYIRIIRFQRALYSLQVCPGANINQLAEECGYYDKSHLIKEIKEFSGHSPTSLLSVCDPFSQYHYPFRSVFIDNHL